jgi:glycosyltransferase involved in cell wall biosynthesis
LARTDANPKGSMLLVDALYINNGGGKNLLDLLVRSLRERNMEVMYLLDDRIAAEYSLSGIPNIVFLKSSMLRRHRFYLANKDRFSGVLAFGNIPPSVKLHCPVFTYFHNILFLEKKIPGKLLHSISLKLKSFVIRLLKKNTTKWIVQSKFVSGKLSAAWKIPESDVLVLPVYNEAVGIVPAKNEKNHPGRTRFIYVSDGHFYKNHGLLIEAFTKFNRQYPQSCLVLTIGSNYSTLRQLVQDAVSKGVNIINRGIISRDELKNEYLSADACIYPSLYESFGLGLIEAAQMQLPICAADLPYVFEVVKPNLVFDPDSVDAVYNAMLRMETEIGQPASIICHSKLEELINVIRN